MEEYAYKEKIAKLKKVNIAVAIALGLIPIVALIFDPKLFSILYLISLVIVIAYLFVLRDYFVLEFNKKNTNLDTDMYCEATTPCSGLMVATVFGLLKFSFLINYSSLRVPFIEGIVLVSVIVLLFAVAPKKRQHEKKSQD